MGEWETPLCIVVSRKQTSRKVERRTRFILVFTPNTFYDNRQQFPAHMALGEQETKWNNTQPGAELNFLEMMS